MTDHRTILLVEDDRAHVRLVEEAFSREGTSFRMTVAGSVAEAQQKLQQSGCDLVLADYLLPDGFGSELIPENPADAGYGVVLLTSHGDEQIAVDALKAGACDYIVKSVDSFWGLPRLCQRAIENRDLVRQRRAGEFALHRSEEQLRIALAASRSAIWEFDSADGRLSWHREAADITGLAEAECSLDDYLERVHIEDRSAVQVALEGAFQCLKREDRPVRVEHRILLDCGDTRWLELSGRRVRTSADRPENLAGIVSDITARKQSEVELHLKQQELAHVARLAILGEMVAGVVHEVSQPLAAISSFADASCQLLNRKPVDHTRLTTWLLSIVKSSRHASEIVRRLRDLVARRPRTREVASILDLIDSTRVILHSEELNYGVQVAVDARGADFDAEVDAVEFQQVLINLLRNACEAVSSNSRTDRRVHVEAVSGDREIEVTVSDNGPGMSPETASRVFDSFFTTRPDGLGMGLAISRSIVEAHGGRITVNGRFGEGAQFKVTLPRRLHNVTSKSERPIAHSEASAASVADCHR